MASIACNGDFATARTRSLRIAFILIVILLVVVGILLVLLFFIWLFSKENSSGY
jgi:flagellar basal body-associated protein FliL